MAAQLRTAIQRMGFTQQAAADITQVQGLDSLDEFKCLKDSDVDALCSIIRKPGGTIPNPAGGNRPPVPNPGIPVPMVASNNLKAMCHYLRFKERASRPVVPADITIPNVRQSTPNDDRLVMTSTFCTLSRTQTRFTLDVIQSHDLR